MKPQVLVQQHYISTTNIKQTFNNKMKIEFFCLMNKMKVEICFKRLKNLIATFSQMNCLCKDI